MVRKVGAALAVVAALTTVAACGDDTERPSVSEIKKALTGGDDDLLGLGSSLSSARSAIEAAGGDSGAVDDAIDCVAKALEGSDLSNKALKALIEGDADAKVDGDDEDAAVDVAKDTTECITKVTESLTTP